MSARERGAAAPRAAPKGRGRAQQARAPLPRGGGGGGSSNWYDDQEDDSSEGIDSDVERLAAASVTRHRQDVEKLVKEAEERATQEAEARASRAIPQGSAPTRVKMAIAPPRITMATILNQGP